MAQDAFIVVDMLNDFIDPQGVLYCGQGARDIIPFVRERLERSRSRRALVIFLQDAHDENDREFERFPKHCVAGTWGARVIPELSPRAAETVIVKRRYSGFFETDLAGTLARAKVASVEVVGVCTSICVMDTVGGLVNRDYRVVVPARGVADFDAEFHAFALKRIAQTYGAEVV